MFRYSSYIFLFVVLITVGSCKEKKAGKQEEILAEYKGKFLYKSDIPEDVWRSISNNDSSDQLKSIIDKWLENAVLVAEAETSLSDDKKDKQKLIEDYRNSLLIYEYQQQLIREKLDTGVTEADIIAFYDNNKAAFQLKKNIVKIRYVRINRKNADLNKLRKLMQNPTPENDAELKSYAEKQAENFYIDSNWLYLDDITKEIPLNENYSQQRFLANNKFITIEEKDVLYLLYIIDFRIKDAVSPLEFEKDKIRDILLYRRKLEFLKGVQKSLFDKAVKNGDIKYYRNK